MTTPEELGWRITFDSADTVERCPSSGPEEFHVISVWRCCRDWPVVLGWQVKRCGLCGEVPSPMSEKENAQ